MCHGGRCIGALYIYIEFSDADYSMNDEENVDTFKESNLVPNPRSLSCSTNVPVGASEENQKLV